MKSPLFRSKRSTRDTTGRSCLTRPAKRRARSWSIRRTISSTLSLNGGEAVRYGVGLGRQGFEWSGRGAIQWKQRWPRWFPPNEMIDRQPELAKYRARQIRGTNVWKGGMKPGATNPLGARALYIFQNGKDTLFRLHGSPEWGSIGKSVSSGCVRLIHQDIIDLYDRVPDGTPMVVTSGLRSLV